MANDRSLLLSLPVTLCHNTSSPGINNALITSTVRSSLRLVIYRKQNRCSDNLVSFHLYNCLVLMQLKNVYYLNILFKRYFVH